MSETTNKVTVKTGRVRCAYVHLLTPRPKMNDATKHEYQVCILVPKDDKVTLDAIRSAVVEVARGRFGDKAIDLLRAGRLRGPLRDGAVDRASDPDFANAFFLNARAERKPLLIDENRNDITDPEQFRSGDYGTAVLAFYGYDQAGNRGVGCGIQGMQRWGRGKPMAGAGISRDAFATIEVKADEVELDDAGDAGASTRSLY